MARDLEKSLAAGPEKFGKYYLKELLNSGGLADIWLATDGRGKPFALRRDRKSVV